MIDDPLDRRSRGARGPRRLARLILIGICCAIPAMGSLSTLLQVLRAGQGAIEGLRGVSGLVLGPADSRLYAVGRHDEALAVFGRKPRGVLQFRDVHRGDGGAGWAGLSDVAASPDGRHVYVTAELDDALVVFSRDATADALRLIAAELQEDGLGGVEGLAGASSVAVSPDDELLFVTANVDDALAVFRRDAFTDSLSFVEAQLEGVDGTRGLDGAADVAVSPDGRHVYVAAEVSDAITVFRRVGDRLSWVTRVSDGVRGVDGLAGASSVAVSPDGRHVYAGGRIDDAVVLFDRDSATGGLRFREVYRDGVGGVDGLRGVADLVVHPAGTRVLVAGRDEDAVAVFRRDADGGLAFFAILEDGVDGVDGLAGVSALAISGDGRNAYAAGRDDDALVVFDLPSCQGNIATGDLDGDAFCNDRDRCRGDDLTGDLDGDGYCADTDCNDQDPRNLCAVFSNGFETGETDGWSMVVGRNPF